ncbi:S1C family serine protease [Pontibacillus litoralis]|uniref:Serine protease n=1 Tax=Pontibacillus litoralis JSM 072002 TaxID=1385512 RepID=A0A0A5FVK5_9BACI|nr:trypsin-like peptidase domain-containing protein [Pontibacillus litoralis]KGX84836.1 serine protease [Pontibacillus litoralis JSM 072002]
MGYYDDHTSSRNQQKKPNWLIPALLGGIFGALIVVFALPSLLPAELLPYSGQETEEQAGTDADKETETPNTEAVNVDVTTQVTKVVEDVQEAVVGVVNNQQGTGLFSQEQEGGTGSGVIYKKEDDYAYIVTNHHVIQGASSIEVELIDGNRIEANLLGSDPYTDLAVLRVKADKVGQPIELGSSENVKVGEPALAIGNPLGLRFAGSVTKGIISGTQRAIPQDLNGDGRIDWQAEVIQTDAAINPGNSGGALINMDGQLIGVNSMKIAQSSVEGIGFAIPIDAAKPIIDDLENNGEVTRPYMGIESYSLSELASNQWQNALGLPKDVQAGVFINGVEIASPADRAGLQQYDVITKLDDTTITNIVDLRKYLYEEKEIGEEIKVTFYREGEKQTTTMELAPQSY